MSIEANIEALLFTAQRPLSVNDILQFIPEEEQPERSEIQDALQSIQQRYVNDPNSALFLKETGSGYRFLVKEKHASWVQRLFQEKPPRYSRAFLETLALIAYRQPTTRMEIEEIRGVAVSSHIIKTLIEREWVRVIGHKEVPGRPELLATTKTFLDYFGLKSLEDLPTLQELKDLDKLGEELAAIEEQKEHQEAIDTVKAEEEPSDELSLDVVVEVEAQAQETEAVEEDSVEHDSLEKQE